MRASPILFHVITWCSLSLPFVGHEASKTARRPILLGASTAPRKSRLPLSIVLSLNWVPKNIAREMIPTIGKGRFPHQTLIGKFYGFSRSIFQPCTSTAAGRQLAATTSEERAMMAAFGATTTARGDFSRKGCPTSGGRTINDRGCPRSCLY